MRKSCSAGAAPYSTPDPVTIKAWLDVPGDLHKTANVLNQLPKSVQPRAKEDIHQIWMAETRRAANQAFDAFLEKYGAKYPEDRTRGQPAFQASGGTPRNSFPRYLTD